MREGQSGGGGRGQQPTPFLVSPSNSHTHPSFLSPSLSFKLAASTPWPVAVRPSPHGGKGLFLTAPVRRGQPILCEAPLAAAPQGFRSRARALACGACGAHAGGAAAQAAHALLSAGRAEDSQVPALLRLVAGLDAVPGAPPLRPPARGSGWEPAPPPPGPTPCPGGCPHELYCSPACAASDWAACHGAVCGGDGAADPARAAAADALAGVAGGGNDALWLAARAAGGCAARAAAVAAAAAAAGGPVTPPGDALVAAWRPWAVAEKALWWEQPAWPPAEVGGGEESGSGGSEAEGESDGGGHHHHHHHHSDASDGEGDEEASFRAGLRGLVEEAAAALAVLLRCPPALAREGGRWVVAAGPPPRPPPLAPAALAPLASPHALGALVGAFELNNLEVAVPALVDCLEEEEAEEEGEGGSGGQRAAKARRGRSGRAAPPLASSWPALLAAASGRRALARATVTGSAFYPLQACANHSCAPTARAVGGAGTHGLVWVEAGGGAGGGDGPTGHPRSPPLPPPPVPAAIPAAALLLAAVDLEAGDEVTLCYVAEGAGRRDRAAGLRDYGIPACLCARCAAEAEGEEEAGEGGAASAPPPPPPPGLAKGGQASAWVGGWRAV